MSKRKIVDLSEEEGNAGWPSEMLDFYEDEAKSEVAVDPPNNNDDDQTKIATHVSNMKTFFEALETEVGKNSENAEILLKALWKEANDLCKTGIFHHKSLRDIVNDVVDDSDDESVDDEEAPINSITDPNKKQWMIMFQQLREYKITNGDCKVPFAYKHNKKLGYWVSEQRKKYKNYRNNKSETKLKPYQITKLESIGMYWGREFPPTASWNERFSELSKYKSVRGNCIVPYNKTCPTPLARWVVAQRMEYKRFKKGRDSLLTLDQIEKLNRIGMKWKTPKA